MTPITAPKSILLSIREDGTPIWSTALMSRQRDAKAGWIEQPADLLARKPETRKDANT